MPTPAPPSVSARDRFLTVAGLRMHCRDTGPSGAPPVVLLHGIMGHAREWDALVDRVAPSFRVIAVDQRGHGETDWASTYTAAALAEDVAGLIDALDLGPVRLIGHSMGGMAGMLLAAARPDLITQLVVVDVGPDSLSAAFAAELAAMLRAMAAVRYQSVDQALAEWMDADSLAREDLQRHYLEHCLVPAEEGTLRYRFDAEGLAQFPECGVTAAELWAAVGRITCPTLLVRGEHSEVLTIDGARRIVDRLGGCQLALIEGAGHDLGVEQPEAVASAALRFLTAERAPV